MEKPSLEASKILFDHPRVKIILDSLRFQNARRNYVYLESPYEAVATLGVNPSGEILLTRQYRHPVGEVIYDLPAGRIEPGETPLEGARREFEEETGHYPEQITKIGYFNQFPGSMRAGTHLFFAQDLRRTRQNLDEGEILEVETLPVNTVLAMVLDGKTIDGSLQLALLLALRKGLLESTTNGDSP